MSGAPPSDGQLQTEFQLDPSLSFEAMASQAAALGASVTTPTLLSKAVQLNTERIIDQSSQQPAREPSVRQIRTVKTRGRGRGRTRGGAVGARTNPVRDNQLEKLASALAEIDTEDSVPIPDEDVMMTHEVDAISARSSRIEGMMEDHGLQLQTANVRIAALEKENSLLVGKINGMVQEIARIKEMLPGSQIGGGGSNSSQMFKSSAPTGLAKITGTHTVATGAGPPALRGESIDTQHADAGVGSRPVSKRKFIG